MDGLTRSIPHLHAALSAARQRDYAHIDDALRRFGVTGVHGEPEVGTTTVIETAIRASHQDSIRVDLYTATDEHTVAWAMAHGLARTVMGRDALSQMAAPDLQPTWAQQAYVKLAEQVGQRTARFAVGDGRSDIVGITEVLDGIATVFEQAAMPPVLWIDHLQAPLVISRHQVDVDHLLWNLRGLQQKVELPIIISGSRTSTAIAYGETGAFHGDGVWVTLGRPGLDVWGQVAVSLGELAPSPSWVTHMAEITHSHPQSMLLALALCTELPQRGRTPLELWQFMLSLDAGHTARAMQHARSLHRLGGDVLEGVAKGMRPYGGARTKSEQMERTRAVKRLHEGGLITQPRPRAWEVTNPLLAGRLRGEFPLTSGDARPFEVSEVDEIVP